MSLRALGVGGFSSRILGCIGTLGWHWRMMCVAIEANVELFIMFQVSPTVKSRYPVAADLPRLV